MKRPGLTQFFQSKFQSEIWHQQKSGQRGINGLKIWPAKKQLKKTIGKIQTGFTMLEILIVVAILALLIISLFLSVKLQLMRTRDAQRKAHLEKLKVVFENYYNDNECYPPAEIFFNGGTAPDPAICDLPLAELQPYLDKVPCDPDTRLPYSYFAVDGGQVCDGYRLYTQLEDKNDKGIVGVGCSKAGCGDLPDFNYGVSAGGSLAVTTEIVTPTIPAGMPTGFNGGYSCSPNSDSAYNEGNPYCRPYDFPADHGCGASTTTQVECDSYCYVGSPIICDD